MTGLYWTAAVLALMWAGYTAVRLRRGARVVTFATATPIANSIISRVAARPGASRSRTSPTKNQHARNH